MKIKNIIILSIVFMFLTNAFSQESDYSSIAVYYEVSFKSDSTDMDFVSNDLMVLYVGDRKSKFRNFYQVQGDSLLQIAKDKGMSPNEVIPFMNQVPKPKMSYAITKDWENKKYEFSDLIFPDYFVFESPLGEEDWQIIDEHDEINGYKIQKAVTNYAGREFEAWFTEEISISDGPYVFGNLPGLILKINDTKGHYNFEMIRIEKKIESLSHNIKRKPIKTTRSKFFEMQYDFNTNVVGKMASGGVTLTDANQARDVQKRFDRKNNPLELVVDTDF
ncbi:GLPGLI family protein [Belliella sp. DSM 111904]|uniref:GLPGLI family protein n=1 Tax=Belliella filtrata TaxID=2923435 RepID=A0ABS9V0C9_9BACT|nr:GLPGLI family protein [Belliella filtrata]MCH7409866.1 GLPGLI family protein [Belliella filtrata]